MAPRSRTANITRAKGTMGYANSSSPTSSPGPATLAGYKTISDQTGPDDCAPLHVEKVTTSGGIINKDFKSGTFESWFKNYSADVFDNLSPFGHLTVTGVPSDVQAATQAAARTNPSAPYVDVPVDILDTRLGLQRLGARMDYLTRERTTLARARVRQTGDRWLTNQFSISPLVGDIAKLLFLNEQMERRIATINRLYNGKGFRKTVLIGRYEAFAANQLLYLQSNGVVIYNYFDVRTYVELKVHCRWYPQTIFAVAPLPSEISALARRALLGLTVDVSTAWELMPWSWLVDWFSNISEFLIANRNVVPAVLTGVFPMRHTKTYWECPGFDYRPAWASCTPVQVIRETKLRSSSFVAPYAEFDLFTGQHIGILAAIVATHRG
jgi:hypothetical protein